MNCDYIGGLRRLPVLPNYIRLFKNPNSPTLAFLSRLRLLRTMNWLKEIGFCVFAILLVGPILSTAVKKKHIHDVVVVGAGLSGQYKIVVVY